MTPLEEMGRFATVVVDPPWPIDGNEMPRWGDDVRRRRDPVVPKLQYQTMTLSEIERLAIPNVLADDAFVFVWTINKFFFSIPALFDAWGITFCYPMTWVKTCGISYPNAPRYNTEYIAVGRKGSPQYREIKAFKLGNVWPRRSHSEKPEEFYDLLRRVTPGPRLDVFGRRRIAGFHSWGNEAPEGPPPPETYQQVLCDVA